MGNMMFIKRKIYSQLSHSAKNFQLSKIDKNARMREYESSFVWLREAKIVNICFNSTDPFVGLSLNMDRTTLKC
jgi:hypothetical protein